jgi:hypothetical protein
MPPPEEERLMKIFFPFARGRQAAVTMQGIRFAHYTTAEAAMNILRTKEVWMRESSCMNDYMEVEHGLNCVLSAYSGDDKRFKRTIDGILNGVSVDIERLFDSWIPHIKTDTYLTCVSEHDSREDAIGRLSMWRAYGNAAGVALVMNNAVFMAQSTALKAYASPVAYLLDKDFKIEFENITDNIIANADFIRTQDRQLIINVAFHMLRFAALCTKHPGFSEEREWRVIYCPILEKSDYLIKDMQAIRGAPQTIYKIPLKDIPSEDFVGAEIPALIDRIIIGPTQYPLAMWKAFVSLLTDAGVSNPSDKVFVSDIPIRR